MFEKAGDPLGLLPSRDFIGRAALFSRCHGPGVMVPGVTVSVAGLTATVSRSRCHGPGPGVTVLISRTTLSRSRWGGPDVTVPVSRHRCHGLGVTASVRRSQSRHSSVAVPMSQPPLWNSRRSHCGEECSRLLWCRRNLKRRKTAASFKVVYHLDEEKSRVNNLTTSFQRVKYYLETLQRTKEKHLDSFSTVVKTTTHGSSPVYGIEHRT